MVIALSELMAGEEGDEKLVCLHVLCICGKLEFE